MTWGKAEGMLSTVSRRSPWFSAFSAFGLLVLAATPLGSCSSGTETGNPSFQAELSYTAFSSAPSQVGLPASDSAVVVENAWLDLAAVGLLNAGSCSAAEAVAVSVPALGIGDHATGKHNVTLFELTAGSYCGIDLPFVHAASSALVGAPDQLAEHSILIEGTLADGTPFQILSSATPTVHLAADAESFAVNESSPHALIAFDLAAWLADLDFASAARVGGSIHVSALDNPALLARFEQNLASGIALYRDDDGDGKLDPLPVRLAHAE